MFAMPRSIRLILTLSSAQTSRWQSTTHSLFMLPLVLVLIAAPAPSLEVLSIAAGKLRAFVVVNGEERTVQVGDVLARGTLVGQGVEQYCEMAETTYGLSGSTFGEANLSLQVTSDCQLVVSAIDAIAETVSPGVSGSESMRPDSPDSSQSTSERTFVTNGPDGEQGE